MKSKKSKNKQKTLSIALIALFAILLFSTLAFAIPNTLTLQGKLTNTAEITKVMLL